MPETRLVEPGPAHHRLYKTIGAAFLALNRARYALHGYRDPRPFPASDFDRACRYDLAVVAAWLRFLEEYLGAPARLEGLSVLELGPGADLGVGVTLLALGADRYSAMDVNPLAASVPETFYRHLARKIADRWPEAAGRTEELRREIDLAAQGASDRLRYVCRRDFDLAYFGAGSIDLTVSHAALEHFDDPAATFGQLLQVVRPDGLLVAQIDLQTHTRWIRERDPLNLYRYSDAWYRAWRFRGAPNRVRPHEYVRMLAASGWRDVRVMPDLVLPDAHVREMLPRLSPRFRLEENRMEWLTVYLCARR